jgi:RNA polymerase sigma-70 factor (ECF subfamily)
VTGSEDTLLAGMAAGDAEAAAAFVRRFQRAVFGLALTILGDRAAAEDVSQEVFVRAWRSAATFDARRGSVLSWLLGITRNAAIDVLRLRRAEPVDPQALADRLQVQARPGDATGYGDREQVRRALADLSADQRRAIVLATYFGRTAREIAELDGIPLGTAKSRIRNGMFHLREALETVDET